jgi:hypothetical protein
LHKILLDIFAEIGKSKRVNQPIQNDTVTVHFNGEITLKSLLAEMQLDKNVTETQLKNYVKPAPIKGMEQFVDGDTLLKMLFPSDCRPTIRWLRERTKKRSIPFVKIGRLVFFDPESVREKLTQDFGKRSR